MATRKYSDRTAETVESALKTTRNRIQEISLYDEYIRGLGNARRNLEPEN